MKSILNLVAGILFGLFLAALIWVASRNPSGQAVTLRPAPTERPLIVHITGAVPRPGVYALPKGARVQDAVSAAGGFLAEADQEPINLAQELEDGQRLDIPYAQGFSPVIPTPAPGLVLTPSDFELVNINTAAAFELETLPGVGPTLAQKIVEYRDQNGPFLSTEDIINVSGVGPGTYERIKDLITVGP
ncbi:MAG: helix-hairpin-helix domain-containing protein [Chloroflexi bacterium]|nr:helix-hairpin-helix domain-containing protein [Chloroflexota bacterium]